MTAQRRYGKMKKIALIFALVLVLMLASCSAGEVIGTDTSGTGLVEGTLSPVEMLNETSTLDLGFLSPVTDADVEGYHVEYGFGCSMYLPARYPENALYAHDGTPYIKYEETAYPDYADGGRFITRIECTDPDVRVFGTTLRASMEELREAIGSCGFEVGNIADVDFVDYYTEFTAKDENISIVVRDYGSYKHLVIRAEVTNREGIIY